MSQEAAQNLRRNYFIPQHTITVVYDRHGPVAHEPECCGLCSKNAEQRAYRRAAGVAEAKCTSPGANGWCARTKELNRKCEWHKFAAQLEAEGAESQP